MAFKVVEKVGGGGSRLGVPGIHLTKNTSCLNYLFCQKLKLKKVGVKIGVELLFDDETSEFALQFDFEHPEKHSTIITYNKSHQCQIYLRSMLRGMGYVITKSHAAPVKYLEDQDLWTFTIPDSCKATDLTDAEAEEDDETLETVKKGLKSKKTVAEEVSSIKKKSKRKNKNKLRRPSDLTSRE